MLTIEELEKRVSEIEKRNRRVELDKAWQDSWIRRGLVAIFTYLSIAFYLKFVVGVEPWINAVVPTVVFLLSTLTLPFLKKVWVKFYQKG